MWLRGVLWLKFKFWFAEGYFKRSLISYYTFLFDAIGSLIKKVSTWYRGRRVWESLNVLLLLINIFLDDFWLRMFVMWNRRCVLVLFQRRLLNTYFRRKPILLSKQERVGPGLDSIFIEKWIDLTQVRRWIWMKIWAYWLSENRSICPVKLRNICW